MPSEDRYVERDDPVGCAQSSWTATATVPVTRRRSVGAAEARSAAAPRGEAPAGAPSAAGPRANGVPSTATTGITSRTEDDVNTSSAARRRSSGNTPSTTSRPVAVGELEQGGARLAGEDADLERRRHEHVALPPPDVRHRPLEHDAVRVDEDGVVGAAGLRLGLGRHADGVARRLRRREHPRAPNAAGGAARRAADRARAPSSIQAGIALTSAIAQCLPPGGPGVQYRRSTASGERGVRRARAPTAPRSPPGPAPRARSARRS